MRSFSKVAGFIAAVLLVGIGLGWWATRKQGPLAPVTTVSSQPKAEPAPTRLPFFSTNERPHRSHISTNRTTPQVAAGTTTNTNLLTDWEERIDDILGPEGEELDKARKMLALFPRLPEEGQIEVAQHLSNLLPDQEYASLGAMLTNSKMPESVLDVLMVDVLNRPNSLKLPLLLEVARDPQNPKAGEAKDLMELYLEEDYGTDWNKWQTKLQQWLQENPD